MNNYNNVLIKEKRKQERKGSMGYWNDNLGYVHWSSSEFYQKPKTFEDFKKLIDNTEDNIPLKAFETLFGFLSIDDAPLIEKVKQYYEVECKSAKVYRPFEEIWKRVLVYKCSKIDSEEKNDKIIKSYVDALSIFEVGHRNEIFKILGKNLTFYQEKDIRGMVQLERELAKRLHLIFPSFGLLEVSGEWCLSENGVYRKGKAIKQKIEHELTKLTEELSITETPSKRNQTLKYFETMKPAIPMKEFDIIPNTINILDGILKLDTKKWEWKFIPHEKLKKPLKTFIQFPIKHDEKAECLQIDQFLTDIFGFENVPLIYEMIAYIFMSHVKFQKAFNLYGPPQSGKTTFIEFLIKFIKGTDIENRIVTDLSLQDLNKDYLFVNLQGKVLNIHDDLEKTEITTSDKFRISVTNEYLWANKKYVPELLNWKNRVKHVFSCNRLPKISKDTGNEFWRRWVLIECFKEFKDKDKMIYEDEQDPNILERKPFILEKICTLKEFSGVLNKVKEAWIELAKRKGFPKEWNNTEHVKNLWQMDIEPCKLFVDEHCEIGENKKIFRVNYYDFNEKVNQYRKDKGFGEKSLNAVTKSLRRINKKIERNTDRRNRSTSLYYGIRIKEDSPYCPSTIELNTGIDPFLEKIEDKKKKIEKIENVDYSDTDRLL